MMMKQSPGLFAQADQTFPIPWIYQLKCLALGEMNNQDENSVLDYRWSMNRGNYTSNFIMEI